MPIYSDDPEEEYRIEKEIDNQLEESKLPETINLVELRKLIPHTVGEYPPNDKGELLCNGHCDWNHCNMDNWQCENCGYIECDGCAEEFGLKLDELGYTKAIDGDTYCRNCGRLNSTDEYTEVDEEEI